ncbi:hypothetical protein PMIN03_010886 [Paraphaeosphaeria minitans]
MTTFRGTGTKEKTKATLVTSEVGHQPMHQSRDAQRVVSAGLCDSQTWSPVRSLPGKCQSPCLLFALLLAPHFVVGARRFASLPVVPTYRPGKPVPAHLLGSNFFVSHVLLFAGGAYLGCLATAGLGGVAGGAIGA